MACLIVPTTQPDEIEQYGIRVGRPMEAAGRKGVEDGAILLVAKKRPARAHEGARLKAES